MDLEMAKILWQDSLCTIVQRHEPYSLLFHQLPEMWESMHGMAQLLSSDMNLTEAHKFCPLEVGVLYYIYLPG